MAWSIGWLATEQMRAHAYYCITLLYAAVWLTLLLHTIGKVFHSLRGYTSFRVCHLLLYNSQHSSTFFILHSSNPTTCIIRAWTNGSDGLHRPPHVRLPNPPPTHLSLALPDPRPLSVRGPPEISSDGGASAHDLAHPSPSRPPRTAPHRRRRSR